MRYFLSVLIWFFVVQSLAFAEKSDHYREVPLKEFTSLDLYLAPDVGTRLIFPFVLDDPAHKPAFYMKNTNGTQIKTSLDQADHINGQNSLVVFLVPPDAGGPIPRMLSDLFLSVDGYNISIRLHTTDQLNKHAQNIVFTISDAERFALIERQVAARLEQATQMLDKRQQQLEDQSKSMAVSNMGVIALHTPKITRLKERLKNNLLTGERVDLLLNAFRNYEDQYYMLDFSIDNQGPKALMIESLLLLSLSKQAQEPIDTSWYCQQDQAIQPDSETQCLVITTDPMLLRAKKLKLTIGTNFGVLAGEW